ncbi:MAG: CotH kinase family protein, partial [Prevotella sp.]|nr:CotH kinase family protein [Prevotella sp.]
MKRTVLFLVLMLSGMVRTMAQPPFSQPHGLYDGGSISVSITSDEGAEIRYTTDGSEPNAGSTLYTNPLQITKTTILRAVEVRDGAVNSSIATASYIFIGSVLKQSNNPSGYPKQWGEYTQIWGTAEADYEMDPEMTSDKILSPKISEGLKQIPILSIVSDKDNFFSHENDPDRGGIYIFTGPPVGDNTGHGWTRPASVELFGGPQQHDLSTDCGVRLHGGHGRLAEKNPKHSFRLVFKEKYGPKTLKYPLFGEDEPAKFDQLVLRCHFGNAWQHWAEGNRQKAQYTRDVWARRMQRKLGRTSVNALYVHLFLNGMYWGLYNLAERVDEQFGKDHIGGDKSDIDVIKIEEDGGNHIEASAGTLDAWNLMTETVTKATDEAYYQQLDTLLDIDNFIDYMIINQYAGNTDWDHHNWYAIRRHNTENALSEGFRFLCWDSEIILENERENVLSKNNGAQSPTGIFQQLLRNDDFARRYLRRAKQLLKDDGLLGQESVVAVWDSLYHTISTALYDEAARWGDYRRDVHRWQTAGQLYTVDNHYMAERNRLLTQYFPVRTDNVLNQITSYVNIDDFEMPDGWEPLMASMFHEWDGSGINAKPLDKQVKVDWNFNTNAGGGTAIAGFVNVDHNQFADLSAYDKLVLRGTGDGLRILANRLVAHGPWKQINVSFNSYDPYWDNDLQAIVLPLEDLKNAPTNEGRTRNDAFVHLNALKVDWSSMVNVRGAYLIPSAEALNIAHILASRNDNRYYNLQGQPVDHPSKGIYIKNG